MSQLQILFEALRVGDLHAARQVGERIAEDRERLGHVAAARTLRSALRADGHILLAPPMPVESPAALSQIPANVRLSEVELPPDARATLDELVLESRYREKLAALRLPRRSRLLIAGPPGVGKSLTARALGDALGLPVYVVRMDAIVGSLLGQTSSRLHEVFRFAEHYPSVLLLDEADALGRRRGEQLDVAEIDRVVVGLMQELDYAQLPGMLVATTNFIESIDLALRRRFDVEIELPLPNPRQRLSFIKKRSATLSIKDRASAIALGLKPHPSYADIDRALLGLARQRALADFQAHSAKAASKLG